MLWGQHGFHGHVMEPHRHDMHELFICLNDEGEQHVAGKRCAFRRGRAFFLYSGLPHHLEHTPERPGEFVFICFDPAHFLNCGQTRVHAAIQRGTVDKHYFSGTQPAYLERNVRVGLELREELSCGMLLSQERAGALLADLVVGFFRSLDVPGEADADTGTERLRRLCVRIGRRPAESYRLDAAAEEVGMSRAKFTRRFKAATGFTFCEFVNDCRLRLACRALAERGVAVSEAALANGFDNLGYFHREFKKKFGRTPLQVKRIYQANQFPHFLKEYD